MIYLVKDKNIGEVINTIESSEEFAKEYAEATGYEVIRAFSIIADIDDIDLNEVLKGFILGTQM